MNRAAADKKSEIDELEAIDEVEELLEDDGFNSPDQQLLELERSSYIVILKEKYLRNHIPAVITNPSLVILWHNVAFGQLFGNDDGWEGRYLTSLISTSLGDAGINDIYRKLRSPESGYSWQGHVEGERQTRRKLLAHLSLLPLFGRRDSKEPVAYIAFFSDLSLYHHQMMRNTFSSLLEASKLKDNDTGNHIQRVNEYSQMMTHHLFGNPEYEEIDRDFLEDIGFLAAMHDVGKIGTPDDILNRAGGLNDWEWEIMKEHTINGAYILSTYPNPMARDIALFHHEKWNGEGYPYQLKELAIPLAPRIVALADVYDALRMKRSYKESYSHKKAMDIIMSESGTHFDPALCLWFEKLNENFRDIYDNLKD